MKRPTIMGLCVAVVLVVGAFGASVADATPHYYVAGVKAAEGKTFPSFSWGTLTLANGDGPDWKVNGDFLAAGDTVTVETEADNVKTKVGGVTIVCAKMTDAHGLTKGGDKFKEVTLKGCKQTAPEECDLPDKPTQRQVDPTPLKRAAGKFFDLIVGLTVELEVATNECNTLTPVVIEGDLEGEWNNSTSALEFPETPLPGSTLKTTTGESVVMSGSDKFVLEEEGGKKGLIEVGEEPSAVQPFTCEKAILGEYKNPTGGGAGEAVTDNFATTNCADVECPEEDGLELQVHSSGLPWSGGLVESGTEILLETKAATFTVGCYVAHTETLVAAPTVCTGNSDPETKNGSGTLSQSVSKVLFTGQSDKLACTTVTEGGEVNTECITEKSLNTMAYGSPVPTKKVNPLTTNASQATLETKNP